MNTKSSDSSKPLKQGDSDFSTFHNSDAVIRDKDPTAGTGDLVMHQGGAEGASKSANASKHESTSVTFEKKKDKDHDKDMRDVHKDKDVNKDKDVHTTGENKGIINTIKEKVKDVLGSGDNDKAKDQDKHMTSSYDKDKNVGVSVSSTDKSHLGTSTAGVSGSTGYSKL